MARVVLLTGGNQGDVKRTLQTVQRLVNERVGAVLRRSHRYESKPWGFAAAAGLAKQAPGGANADGSLGAFPLEHAGKGRG